MVYDQLRRLTHRYVAAGAAAETLADRLFYGELLGASAATTNHRGRALRSYDSAGEVQALGYDFKGNPLQGSRRVANVYATQPDWTALASLTTTAAIDAAVAPLVSSEVFSSSTTYDALNRPMVAISPDASQTRHTYNEAGLLDAIDIRLRGAAAWSSVIANVDYDAKGRRTNVQHGNGTVSTYVYDPLSLRLTQIQTVRTSGGAALQNLRYTYDCVGNIAQIEDAAQQTVFFNNAVVDPTTLYEYDALYRLTKASGRELAGGLSDQQRDQNDTPLVSLPHANNTQAVRTYVETYVYDAVGNFLRHVHDGGLNGSWTRYYDYQPGSNRLKSTSLPGDAAAGPYSATYTHDAHGNIVAMPHLATITWDDRDQMASADKGGGGLVYFNYDASGQRVRKVWVHSGIVEERIYLGSYEVYRRRVAGAVEVERQTLHVNDVTGRVLMVETKTIDVNVPAFTPVTRWRFQLSNHLGSASLEVSEAAAVISYEEYHPFGTTAYRSSNGDVEVSAKRYRYTGKERDEETGFGYHGARYLALWLGRWGSADPSGLVDGANLFAYVRGNPVGLSDPSGREGTSAPSFHQAFLSHELSRFDISKAAVDRLLGRVPEPSEDGKKPWLYDVRVHPTTQVIGGALMGAIRAEVPLLAPFHPPLSHEAADAERKTELLFGALKLQDAFANTPKGPPPGTFPGLLTPEGATALTRVAELPPGSVGALVAVGHSGAQLLSTGGGASRPTEPPQAREDAPANQTEKPAPALPPKKTATQWRNTPGTATGAGFKVRPDRPWLVQGRAGHVPESVAARLAGRTFKNFDEYRAAFWRAVGEDPDLMRQFGRSNQAHILKGEAPYAATSQQIGDQPQYEVFNLHHKKSIESGGAVYDAENILVASPLQHYRGLH